MRFWGQMVVFFRLTPALSAQNCLRYNQMCGSKLDKVSCTLICLVNSFFVYIGTTTAFCQLQNNFSAGCFVVRTPQEDSTLVIATILKIFRSCHVQCSSPVLWMFCIVLFCNGYANFRVKGPWHAFSKIFREGGVRGLWKGWVPNVQRAALVNMGG